MLVFDESERGPSDDLVLQFEAVSNMPDDERRIIKALLDRMIIKYQTRKMVDSLSSLERETVLARPTLGTLS